MYSIETEHSSTVGNVHFEAAYMYFAKAFVTGLLYIVVVSNISSTLEFVLFQYLAPEVLRKQPYDYAVDWWCLGSVLYEMLFGLVSTYAKDVSNI